MQSLMNFKVESHAHDVLSEQNIRESILKEQTNICKGMIYYGGDINVENFGKLLGCYGQAGKATTADDYWKTGDHGRSFILDTLREKYGKKLLRLGLSTQKYKEGKKKRSFRISKATASGVVHGDKKGGPPGYFLNTDKEIYLTNGELVGGVNGFNDYNGIFNIINNENRRRFINDEPNLDIVRDKPDELAVDVYEHITYKLRERRDGFYYYLPITTIDKEKKVGTKEGPPLITSLGQRTFGNTATPFGDNQIILRQDLYDVLKQDLLANIRDRDITLSTIGITSSASLLNTSYPSTTGTKTYGNNTQLARDRGTNLWQRLLEDTDIQNALDDMTKEMPVLDNGSGQPEVTVLVQPCNGTLSANGQICTGGTDDITQRFVTITYGGSSRIETEEDVYATAADFVRTLWQLDLSRR